MKMRWHQCELYALFLEVCDESLRALIIQELYLGVETPFRQMRIQAYLFRNKVFLRSVA